MAPPTFQAEGTIAASATLTPPAPTIPAHQADDILIASVIFWGPDPAPSLDQIPTPSGWTLLGSQLQQPAGTADGWVAQFWKRATSGAETITLTAGANWTSNGTTTCFASRVDVIRGATTGGTPYENWASTGPHTASNQTLPACNVNATGRLGLFYSLSQDNLTILGGTSLTGATPAWTVNAATTTATGSDASIRVGYLSGHNSNFAAGAATSASAPAQGAYFYMGYAIAPPGGTSKDTLLLGVG